MMVLTYRPAHEICAFVSIVSRRPISRVAPTGNVEQGIRDSALVARSFIVVYSDWMESSFGRRFTRPPATTSVRLHVHPGHLPKGGTSVGAAITGRRGRVQDMQA